MVGLIKKLAERRKEIGSCLCIGIDPDEEDINNFMKNEKENAFQNIRNNLKEDKLNAIEKGKDLLLKEYESCNLTKEEEFFYFLNHFCFYIINTTKEYALIYKMNFAFFIVHGSTGVDVLKNLFLYLKKRNIPTILDLKTNDIGNTLRKYQTFVFDYLESDACTVNIYMGADILKNICYDEVKDKRYSVFVLIKTTNPGSSLFQNQLQVNNKEAYFFMADEAEKMSQQLHMEENEEFIGFVVGANSYNELGIIRKRFPNCYILAPGVGAQEADLQKSLRNGFSKDCEKLMINIGRSITKSKDPRAATQSYYEMINNIIKSF